MTVVVTGFRETARAFGKVNRQFPRDLARKLREAADPVRADAEVLAGTQIRNLGVGDPWAQMRVGGGVTIVYVAPKKRQTGQRQKRRTNLADLLMKRAMLPALERNREKVVAKVDSALEDMEHDWGRGG